jgi:hypothetical protein
MNSHARNSWRIAVLLAGLIQPLEAAEPGAGLQAMIDRAMPGGEVVVPAGTWTEPLRVNKALKLRGASTDTTILDVTADQPAVQISGREPVLVEAMTVRWQRATSNRSLEAPAAVRLHDASLTLRSVRVEAPGVAARCPSALHAQGFSEVRIEQCHFKGFEFTLQFGEGAKGVVADSVIWKPGHAGVTAGPRSAVEVLRCVIAGSAFHGVRCTGGELKATDNLVIANKNRGFYLGNKSATGVIRNNVIQDNGTGISGFAESDVEVAHNVIVQSSYAALDARDTCRLRVYNNALLDNARGLVLFKEAGANKNQVLTNLSWGNKVELENFDPSPPLIRVNPAWKDAANGDFSPTNPEALTGHGLQEPARFKPLWAKWTSLRASNP